ncbi:VIT1/CCC1 transporter family protein [Candidatus Woesebacteria bacterium]|nr:VIT1/CCC1 transporter family protein [Candidatus Woesebacteria bacterium]
MKITDKYLKGAVLGASDGIITTFAVVAGVVGAGFATEVIIVLGIANMVADGISMAIGDFLGERSVSTLHKFHGTAESSILADAKTSLITFCAFVLAGTLPLLPYLVMLFGFSIPENKQFAMSLVSTLSSMFFVGSLRTYVIKGNWFKNGLEMLAVGSLAATAAYTIGAFIENFVR